MKKESPSENWETGGDSLCERKDLLQAKNK